MTRPGASTAVGTVGPAGRAGMDAGTGDGAGTDAGDGADAGVDAPVPVALCDTRALAGSLPASAGALWKLAESGRQLDANLIHLPPRQRVATHTEPDLDVLLLAVTGSGTVGSTAGPLDVTAGALLWLPHGSTRSLTAGQDGLSYLTVHQRRPGMQIRPWNPGPAHPTT